MDNNLEKALSELKAKNPTQYDITIEILEILKLERVKLVGNNLREILNRQKKELNKESIIYKIKRINDIFKKNNVNYIIPEDWDNIDKWLRLSILEDIDKEFKSQ